MKATARSLYGGLRARPIHGPQVEHREVLLARRTTRTTLSGHLEDAVYIEFTNGTHMVVHPYSEWDIDEAAS